jgi:hypothetical protein
MNSGDACYCSEVNLLSSLLLSINVRTGVYKTTVLPVVLYGYETRSLI